MPLPPETRLGPYVVVSPLGAGGMGEVYRATDTKLGREVAIKVLPAEVAGDAERLARFEREAKLLASLNHSNIAHVYGFESATLEDGSSVHFLAMELVPGEDLAERLKRGRVPVDETIAIASQLAEALEEAHQKGIVHRDLKPANVKLTPDGKVKVLDFGLAKAWEGQGAASADLSQSPTLAHTGTAAGVILGTAAYMSPEQARGKAVDKRADIWAFGVVLWEMLTGQRLFVGESVSDVLAGVLKMEVDLGALPAETPPAVRRLLRRCLERDPRNRLHDVADARLELREGPRAAAGAGDLPTRAAGPSRWRKVAAGAALLVVGGLVGVATRGPRAVPAESPAVRFNVVPPGTGGRIQNLTLSADGRRLVYMLSSEPRLLVHDLAAFESRPLAGTEGATAPFLSPDGDWIGFKQAGKVRKIALDGGDPVDVCDLPENTPGLAWGPGGVILFSPAWTNVGLWRVSASGGQSAELTKPDRARGESGHFWPDFLPDGRAALFTIFGGKGLVDSRVGLVDLDTGRYEALFEGAAPRYLHSGHILYYRGGVYRTLPFDLARRRVSGPETTVLPTVRRLHSLGDRESYVALGRGGVLAFVEGDSSLGEPLSRLTWVARDGRREDLPFEAYHHLRALSLSPDGTRAAVGRVEQGQMQVHVYDMARGTGEAVTRDGQSWSPAWHPDGRSLAVTSQLRGSFDVRRVPADAHSAPESVVATDADEGDWRWAPDGASAVFRVWSPGSGTDLWRAKGDGGEPAPLVASPLEEDHPAFSSDGRWLAYLSGASLYVAPYPSLAPRVLVAQTAASPRWSRATRELFYVEAGRLKAMPYEVREGAFRPASAATLFEIGPLAPTFDVSPDGRRFLFLVRSPGSPERDVIRVVLNGFEALRAAP